MAGKRLTNIKINGIDYYRIRLKTGEDSEGKPIHKSFYGKSKTEAEGFKKEYQRQLDSGIDPNLSNQSLEKAMYTWLWEIEKASGNKTSTFERYELTYRIYIKGSTLGKVILSDLKKLQIQKYYNELLENDKSISIIANLHKLLSKFFRYAVADAYIILSLIHISEPTRLGMISYAVFCLKKKK